MSASWCSRWLVKEKKDFDEVIKHLKNCDRDELISLLTSLRMRCAYYTSIEYDKLLTLYTVEQLDSFGIKKESDNHQSQSTFKEYNKQGYKMKDYSDIDLICELEERQRKQKEKQIRNDETEARYEIRKYGHVLSPFERAEYRWGDDD